MAQPHTAALPAYVVINMRDGAWNNMRDGVWNRPAAAFGYA